MKYERMDAADASLVLLAQASGSIARQHVPRMTSASTHWRPVRYGQFGRRAGGLTISLPLNRLSWRFMFKEAGTPSAIPDSGRNPGRR